eukprot:SAG22_NODE_10923_length_509_cov_1.336585_1_plen_45_part_10
MIRCLFGDALWRVGAVSTGTGAAGRVQFGLSKGHAHGLPRDGLLA